MGSIEQKSKPAQQNQGIQATDAQSEMDAISGESKREASYRAMHDRMQLFDYVWLNEDIRNLVAYFRTQGRRVISEVGTVNEVIDDAFVRGSKRMPIKTDVFVHPEFPFKEVVNNTGLLKAGATDHIIQQTKEEYAERIRALLRESDNPVVLTYADAKKDLDSLPYSEESAVQTWHPNSGMVAIKQLPKWLDLLRGLNLDDEYLIHGANFGQCPTRAALQLYAAQQFRNYYGTNSDDVYRGNQSIDKMIFGNEHFMFSPLIYKLKLFNRSRIRMGTLYDGSGIFAKHEHQSLTDHMLDENTVIFPDLSLAKQPKKH